MTQQGQSTSDQTNSANTLSNVASENVVSENDLIAQRHAKLKTITEKAKQNGSNAWPNHFKRDHYAGDLQAQFDGMTKEQILSIMKPENFVGRSVQQTEEFFKDFIDPILAKEKDALGMQAAINV